MTEYEEEFCGLKLHPSIGIKFSWDYIEERTLDVLMELTDIHKFHSKEAISEFFKRLFLIQDIPLNSQVDRHFNDGILFKIDSGVHQFTLYSNQIDELIGIARKNIGSFDYTGTTKDYLGLFDRKHHSLKLTLPKKFKLREETYLISDTEIRNAEIVANVISDQLDDYKIQKIEGAKPFQYARNPIPTIYYDLYKKIEFLPSEELNSIILKTIKEHLRVPFEFTEHYRFSNPEYNARTNAVIQVAFGIKNGFLNPRGSFLDPSTSMDPYYLFDIDPIIEPLMNASSFFELYNQWEMYEWMHLLPCAE